MISLNTRIAAAKWIRDQLLSLDQAHSLCFSLFGSLCTGQLHGASDIDLLIVGGTLPARGYDRIKWLYPVLKAWRDHPGFMDLPKNISPLFLTPPGWEDAIGLQLSLSENAWILHDDGTISAKTMKAQAMRESQQWIKIPTRDGGWLWKPAVIAS